MVEDSDVEDVRPFLEGYMCGYVICGVMYLCSVIM